MTAADLLFTLIGLVCAGSAVLAVTSRHLVHAALWLTVALGSLAGCYLVLGAELVALAQLLVYVGAVVVLVLFALMVTRTPTSPSRELSSGMLQRAIAAVVSLATAALLSAALIVAFADTPVRTGGTGTVELAHDLFSTWVWPFELLSLLLLIALVTAFATYRLPGRSDEDSR
ncbi:NADH-quinone oxidoreductase subunit J [Branchiibius sp. NY16-3462-2]|uniref:NADH-quinone oxidoreductase subunit J family protein n=1 Tax=Branchiibius sp. NY16-3462-2 TaxID=1807500 RepID=UPI00079937AD|nr:NADH-quinone oxidoreductase subunit J [Branchiibius sp. NY16-3462-2]KYH46156.1 NADH dehydrogenase [Branchiibius sp. NY16-3462-2]